MGVWSKKYSVSNSDHQHYTSPLLKGGSSGICSNQADSQMGQCLYTVAEYIRMLLEASALLHTNTYWSRGKS